jgi:outer membrane protein assembly factor BamB
VKYILLPYHPVVVRRHIILPLLLLLLAGEALAEDGNPWVARLASRKYETRELAKQELVAMGLDCLPIVTGVLGSGNQQACRNASDVLGRLGPAVIPFLKKNVGGFDGDACYYSITVLGDLAPDTASAAPLLALALAHDDTDIAYEAAWALAALREKAAPAVDALAFALEHHHRLVRTTAAGALAAIGGAARESTPALLATLDDEDAPVRRAAAEALASIGVQDSEAVPRLIKALADENIYVRMSVARALGTVGPAAAAAVPKLKAALKEPALAADAAWALERITGLKTAAAAAATPAAPGDGPDPETSVSGWRMLGGSPTRNAVASAPGIPDDWDVESGRHVRWSAKLGSMSFGGPIVGGGRVFIGAGNEHRHRPGMTEKCGTLLAFDAEDGGFLWQDHSPNLGRQADFLLPSTTSSPLLEGDRVYYMTAQCQLRCLDAAGFWDEENDGPFVEEGDTSPLAADRIWELDLAAKLGVFPHEASNCSVVAAGDVLLVCTSNGVDEAHTRVASPRAPSFIGVDKRDGSVLWTCVGPGSEILHGQWSSPSLGMVEDRLLAFFGGGDGWLYALEPGTGRVVWRFDGNGRNAVWRTGDDFAGVVRRNSIIACPLFHDGRVYLGLGQDPEHGRGRGTLHAIDPAGDGDVSASRRVWTYPDIGRTITTPIARDGLLYAADLNGRVHCLDVKTGLRIWTHDTRAPIWGGLLLLGKNLLVGNEDGILTTLRAGREKKVVREIEMPSALYAGPVAFAGTLYIATDERLYAIRKK